MMIVCIVLGVLLAVATYRAVVLERRLVTQIKDNTMAYGRGWMDGYFHHRNKTDADRGHIARCFKLEVE